MALQTRLKYFCDILVEMPFALFCALDVDSKLALAHFDFLTQAKREHHIQNKNNNNNNNNNNRVVWTWVSKLDPADFDFLTQAKVEHHIVLLM